MTDSRRGCLYIVATPIGNLEDITFRAVRILKEVDLIAAEDTRHSRKLLTHFGISKTLVSCFEHNEKVKSQLLIEKIKGGLSVALVTDAGTPCISDPGYLMVRDAVAAGIQVIPIPGASAFVTALSASGLATDGFVFEGFLPNRQGKRKERLAVIESESRPVIFYESPKRLVATLKDMLDVFGNRRLIIGRELTKIYEEFIRDDLEGAITTLSSISIRGEVVIIVAPSEEKKEEQTPNVTELLSKLIFFEKLSVRDAVKKVVIQTRLSRSAVYREALKLEEKNKQEELS
jgi:16S rRNA (cytidine1402-2'-O)-methyltransferase